MKKYYQKILLSLCLILAIGTAAYTADALKIVNGVLTSDNIKRGSGTPESAVNGNVGDIYQRINGGAATTLYVKESGAGTNTGWVAVGGGGGGGTTTGAMADIPAAGTAGRVYIPTDFPYSVMTFIDNGSTWDRYAYGVKLTKPVLADYSWVNQGAATASQTEAGIKVTLPAVAGTNYRMLVKTAPSLPYKITALILTDPQEINYTGYGLAYRLSSDGKAIVYLKSYQDYTRLFQFYLNSPTSWNSTGHDSQRTPWPVMFTRLHSYSANKDYRISYNGIDWYTSYATGSDQFFVPDQVGLVGFNDSNGGSSTDFNAYVLHWKQE